MPQKELETVKAAISQQDGRIKSLEDTVAATLPPLLEKFDKFISVQHEVSISMNNLVNQMASHSKDISRFGNRVEKVETNFSALKEEVIEGRPLVRLVKGLGNKMLGLAFTIFFAAIAIVISYKQV